MNAYNQARNVVKFGPWLGVVSLAVAIVGVSACGVDDTNPCTVVVNGPLPEQTVGDCQRNECQDGTLVVTNDNTDVQDDGESCTRDFCSGGDALHEFVEGDMCISEGVVGRCSLGRCSIDCITGPQCNDDNPCTDEYCPIGGAGCIVTNLDGIPTPGVQPVLGDCKLSICENGVATMLDDDTDISDDNESCTADSCSNGTAVFVPVADGTNCDLGGSAGSCSMGLCSMECGPGNPCNDGNPCTEDYCMPNAFTCVFNNLTLQTIPGVQPVPGDCKVEFCNNGQATILNDDADILDDGNVCTSDVCMAGVPSNPPVAAGTACMPGDPKVCDGKGVCVECVEASDCVLKPGAACVNNVCL